MNEEKKTIEQCLGNLERFGAIGSPSSTSSLTLDILGTAVDRKLLGELAAFRFQQDGRDHLALGQITEINLRNVWLENPTMRSIVRQKGKLEPVSERQDTHTATLSLGSVFDVGGESSRPSILGTVPSTGTEIRLVDDDLLNILLRPYRAEIFYLGHVYGSRPKLPMWFKHFGSGPGGAGEAYHIGIFGKTGSGKSVLAKMILLAYARHPEMGIFIIDPQGEFSMSFGQSDLFASAPDMRNILNGTSLDKMGRSYRVYKINELRLDRFDLFAELLIDLNFMQEIGIKWPQYAESVGDYLIDFLRDSNTPLKRIHSGGRDLFIRAMRYIEERIPRIYSQQAGQERMKDLIGGAIAGDNSRAWRIWSKVSRLFSDSAGGKEISEIVREGIASEQKFMILIDLSRPLEGIEERIWDDKVKPLLIKRFLQEIRSMAEQAFYSRVSYNSLVVIDEAHRLAPATGVEDERRDIRNILVDSVRTTRKYGLGWMFISQTIQSLHKDIVLQLRTMFFGFGLGFGSELQSLREVLGGDKDWLRLYQSFKDPQSALSSETKEFPFMVVGPASPLSFSGTPLFFNAFTRPDEFLEANGLK